MAGLEPHEIEVLAEPQPVDRQAHDRRQHRVEPVPLDPRLPAGTLLPDHRQVLGIGGQRRGDAGAGVVEGGPGRRRLAEGRPDIGARRPPDRAGSSPARPSTARSNRAVKRAIMATVSCLLAGKMVEHAALADPRLARALLERQPADATCVSTTASAASRIRSRVVIPSLLKNAKPPEERQAS